MVPEVQSVMHLYSIHLLLAFVMCQTGIMEIVKNIRLKMVDCVTMIVKLEQNLNLIVV